MSHNRADRLRIADGGPGAGAGEVHRERLIVLVDRSPCTCTVKFCEVWPGGERERGAGRRVVARSDGRLVGRGKHDGHRKRAGAAHRYREDRGNGAGVGLRDRGIADGDLRLVVDDRAHALVVAEGRIHLTGEVDEEDLILLEDGVAVDAAR